jgi:hypothetical protein
MRAIKNSFNMAKHSTSTQFTNDRQRHVENYLHGIAIQVIHQYIVSTTNNLRFFANK